MIAASPEPPPPSRRPWRAIVLWWLAGMAAFVLIAWSGDDRRDWPVAAAEVLGTSIRLAPHLNDDHVLSVRLRLLDADPPYEAWIVQAAPKGALEQRSRERFAHGARIQVRVNPRNPSEVRPAQARPWGRVLLGAVVGLLVAASGFTLLFRPARPPH